MQDTYMSIVPLPCLQLLGRVMPTEDVDWGTEAWGVQRVTCKEKQRKKKVKHGDGG